MMRPSFNLCTAGLGQGCGSADLGRAGRGGAATVARTATVRQTAKSGWPGPGTRQ